MSSTTENLGLTLPDVTDFYDVGVTNTNMSLIDAAVGQIADTGAKETSVQSIITKIGTTTDTGGTATTGTVMAKLNALQSSQSNQRLVTQSLSDTSLRYSSSTTKITKLAIQGSGDILAFTYGITAKGYANSSTSGVGYKAELLIDNEIYRSTKFRNVDLYSDYSQLDAYYQNFFGDYTFIPYMETLYGSKFYDYTNYSYSPAVSPTYTNSSQSTTDIAIRNAYEYRSSSWLGSPVHFESSVVLTLEVYNYYDRTPAWSSGDRGDIRCKFTALFDENTTIS